MDIQGLYHINALCSSAQRTTDSHAEVLGLKLVKKTVNVDAVNTCCLYVGDDVDTAGSLLTYFDWPNAPEGRWGLGTAHHLALRTKSGEAQRKWNKWLTDHGLKVAALNDRTYVRSIDFQNPDGHIREIATIDPGFLVDKDREVYGTNRLRRDWLQSQRSRIEQELTLR
jgi:glyoxalase family protein